MSSPAASSQFEPPCSAAPYTASSTAQEVVVHLNTVETCLENLSENLLPS